MHRSIADIESDINHELDQKVKHPINQCVKHANNIVFFQDDYRIKRLTLEDLEQDLPDVLRTALSG